MPAQDCAGSDQPVRSQPSRQEPDQRGHHRPVSPVQPGPRMGPAQYSDLMPQHQEFGVLGGRRPAEQDKPAAEPNEDEIHQPKRHGRSSWPTADADAGTLLQLGGQADFWHPAGVQADHGHCSSGRPARDGSGASHAASQNGWRALRVHRQSAARVSLTGPSAACIRRSPRTRKGPPRRRGWWSGHRAAHRAYLAPGSAGQRRMTAATSAAPPASS